MVRATSQQQQLSEFLGEFNCSEIPNSSTIWSFWKVHRQKGEVDVSELSLSDQLDRMELEDIKEGAKAAIEAMKKSLTNSYEHMIRVGHFLNAMKAKLPHGAWGPWLQENFDDSRQWAHKLMTCAADRANVKSTLQMTTVTTIEQHYSMLMNTPEKQAKKAEREAKKLETPPKPPAPAPPAPPAKPERPAWLADRDELDRPEETDLPPLPRTNTHHTTANRRTPDARETDRAGIVCPDDPRGLQDGKLYVWSESANRLFLATADEIWAAARELRLDEIRGQSIVSHAVTTSAVVEPKKEFVSNKRFTPPTADEVSVYSDEISAGVDGQQFVDFYESKGWMIGKNKMKDWRAAVRTWKRSESQRGSKITTAVRSSRNWDEEIPEWKPTE